MAHAAARSLPLFGRPGAPLACAYIPDFRVTLHHRRAGWSEDTPLALCASRGSRQLLLVGGTARRLGIRPGMSLAEARRVLPELHVETLDPQLCAKEAERLREGLRELAPRLEHPSGGLFYLEWRGLERLYLGPLDFLEALHDQCDQLGYPEARVGMGPNRFCARAAAVLMEHDADGAQGPLLVSAGEEGDFLAPLSLSLLPCSTELRERLSAVGIRTLGELAALPSRQVARRYGTEGSRMQRLAQGEDPHQILAEEEPLLLRTQIEIPQGAEDRERLLQALEGPLEQLLKQLRSRGLGCTRLTLELVPERGEPLRTSLAPSTPHPGRALWRSLLAIHLEQMTTEARPRSISLEVAQVMPAIPAQEVLLGRRTEEHARLDLCLAHLIAMVGEDALHLWDHTADQRPQQRSVSLAPQPFPRRLAPPAGQEPADQPVLPARPVRPDQSPHLPRAYRQLEQPEPIEVRPDHAGRPRHMRVGPLTLEVTDCEGPYDSEGGWWEHPWRERLFRVRVRGQGAPVGWLQLTWSAGPPERWLLQGCYG